MSDIKSPPKLTNSGGGANRFKPKEKPKNVKSTLKRLILIFFEQKKVFAIALFLTLLSALSSLVAPYFMGRLIDTFNIDTGKVNSDLFFIMICGLFLAFMLNFLLSVINGIIMAKVSQKVVKGLRKSFFAKLQKLPLSFFDKTYHGDTMSRLTNDVDNISSSIAQTTTQLFSSIISVIGAFIMMLVLNPYLTMVALVTIPLVLLLTKSIAKKCKEYFSKEQKYLGGVNSVIAESIEGIKVVKAFNQQEELLKKFDAQNQKYCEFGIKAGIWSGVLMPFMNVINNLSYAFIACIGGIFVIEGLISIGIIISFLSYSKQFGAPINNIAGMFSEIQSALAGAERVFEIIDKGEEVKDKVGALNIKSSSGNIKFNNVTFSYDGNINVLKNINFQVYDGQTVAIVGETGSGKTTLVNLLTRFYEIENGEILIDEINITDIKRDKLSKCFSVVLQDTTVFSGTVSENIKYSNNLATQEEVENAAKLACAHEFILKLPEGYGTQITSATEIFSVGEKQLVAIARAILSPAPILILDEATSSVDTRTEKNIQKALTNLMECRTSIMIAHRLSTIRDADNIYVLQDGEICESGNHDELMSRRGEYYKMVLSQLGKDLM